MLEFLPISSLVQSGISPQSGAVPGSKEHAWTWLAGRPVGCGLSHLHHSGPHTASTEQVARATPTQPGERRCGLGAGLQRPVHEAGCALIWGPLLPFAVRKELNHHPLLQEGQDSPPTRGASHRAHTPPPDGARGRRAEPQAAPGPCAQRPFRRGHSQERTVKCDCVLEKRALDYTGSSDGITLWP